ncbi:MAG: MBL fold metallo-hydrolase [Proteobacteria bacterium]|nr:MBL fold metallo-hydrolase [Pseudomonadota bacterium]
MIRDNEIIQAIKNIDFLIANHKANKFSFNEIINTDKQSINDIKAYLQKWIDFFDDEPDFKKPLVRNLYLTLEYFLHLKPNKIAETLEAKLFKRINYQVIKLEKSHPSNDFKDKADTVDILRDKETGTYTSPDDHLAHKHGEEAVRIFFSTQFERFKSFCNWLFAKVGIYIFESANYFEHDYLDSDIFRHDSSINPDNPKEASHYWAGHSSNLLNLPTNLAKKQIRIATDLVEGALAPVIYPRMTKEGSLIDGEAGKRLAKIDMMVLSHNHRDHMSEVTLKRLLKQQPWMIVPEGDKQAFLDLGFINVIDLKWWEQAVIFDENGKEVVKITAVPARHWSGRVPADAHCSAFNGYVFQSKNHKDIYFAGDTALMDDNISGPIFKYFDNECSIQPGGPDERREDMESTHQSSADGILIHFKLIKAKFDKLKDSKGAVTKQKLLDAIASIKTIYNHTATFKLGNLRLRDTFYSHQRLMRAFLEEDYWVDEQLPEHEKKVFEAIKTLCNSITLEDEQLTQQDIVQIIKNNVVMPKIGQRQSLYGGINQSSNELSYLDLITNKRALIEYNQLLRKHLSQEKPFDMKDLIIDLFRTYSKGTNRFYKEKVDLFIEDLESSQNNAELLIKIRLIDQIYTAGKNKHGHMQSLIHYCKFLLESAENHPDDYASKFNDFLDCQQIRKQVDLQLKDEGGFFISTSRKEKQKLFRDLADKLSLLPNDKRTYQDTIGLWLNEQNDDALTNEQRLYQNRSTFFAKDKTTSQVAIEEIKALVMAN